MGCELGQGFLFAKPMNADSLRETMAGADAPSHQLI
jgi:EAL domain-containing protein (putative c-di-GMP-specific phosphodiesterase class I)